MTQPTVDRAAVQRRTLGVLALSQILGGVGFTAGLAVGALLAQDVSGSTELAGLGGTFQVVGGALLAIPMARIMAARGRGPGLIFGYACAFLGAAGLILSAVTRNFPVLLAASVLFGGATASNSQTGFAAADLATPQRRGRDLSLVVWATTIGSVLGPNLVGPSAPIARALHLPELVGPYAISMVGLVVAMVVLRVLLRPDPLLLARELDASAGEIRSSGSVFAGLGYAARHRHVGLGMLVTALGHAVMVSVMVMTPIHMHDGHAALTVIGLVISLHIVGMYALSPLVGMAVDRIGSRPVALVGGIGLIVASVLAAATEPGESLRLTLALILLGLGWSATFVSGSTMVTEATAPQQRPAVQGATTLLMGLAGAGGGALAGYVVGQFGFAKLGWGSMSIAAAIVVLCLLGARRPAPATGDAASGDATGDATTDAEPEPDPPHVGVDL